MWNPVCGLNGQTYGNSCSAEAADQPIRCTGECPCPTPSSQCIITMENDPVCRPMATPVLHGVHDNKSGAEVNAHVLPPHPVAVPLTTTQFVEWMGRPMATPVRLGVWGKKSSAKVNAHVLHPQSAAVPLTTNQFVEWMARPLATLVGLGVRNNKSSVKVNAHVLPPQPV